MIQANELRFNNLLKLGEEYLPLVSFDADRTYDDLGCVVRVADKAVWLGKLSPIPLSEEILLKLGFELDNENGSLDLISDGLKIQLIDKLGKWLIYISGPFGMVMPKQIYYLHQLQNLIFSLTGQELNTSGL